MQAARRRHRGGLLSRAARLPPDVRRALILDAAELLLDLVEVQIILKKDYGAIE